MEQKDGKTLDIQDVSVRLIRLYLEENDLIIPFMMPMVMSKSLVTKVEENVKPSEWFSRDRLQSKPFLETLNYTKIKLDWTRNSSVLTHFHPSIKFENEKRREDLFWITSLQNSCGILTNALTDTATKLRQQFNQDHFLAKVLIDKKIQETKIPFADLQFWQLDVMMNNQFLFIHANSGMKVPSIYDFTNSLDHTVIGIKNRNLVFDLTSMQWGHRGGKGEIVGMFEDFDIYKRRFPGVIRNGVIYKDPEVEARNMTFQSCNPVGEKLKEIERRLVQRFMKELAQGVQWCGYCGKTLLEPLRCSKCKVKTYCRKNCQVSHWKSHKLSCSD